MAPKKIAQTVLTEGKFYTISAANGKVIEVADYNIDNGAKIQLMDNANFEWQQWNFVAAGDGVYRIQNRFTGKMMDLDMGGVSDGTRVHQWEGAQASSQLWVVEPTNDGRVKIKSNLAGKLLDPGMATENGTVLQIWADVNGDNQFWTINEVTRKPKTSVKASAVKAKAAAEKAATEIVDAAAVAVAPTVEKAVKAAKPVAEKAAKAAKPVAEKAVKDKAVAAGEAVPEGLLDGVPTHLPALMQAQKVSRKAAAVGFEWETVQDVWDEVAEERAEFEAEEPGSPEREMEFGYLLFALVNVARKEGIDAESALRASTAKFRRRWAAMEQMAADVHVDLAELSTHGLNDLWDAAKAEE